MNSVHTSPLSHRRSITSEFHRLIPQLIQKELSELPVELQNLISPAALNALINDSRPNMLSGLKSSSEMLMPMLQHEMPRKLGELIGILCLSVSANNLLMWAHYADSHRGFVVGFNTDSPFFDCRVGPDDELRHLRKVTYSLNRPSLTLSDVDNFSSFMTKGVVWFYEEEWRMIMPLDSGYPSSKKGVHLFEFPSAAIASVILGCRMSDEKKAEVRHILAASPKYAHVRCIEAKIDDEHYEVHISHTEG